MAKKRYVAIYARQSIDKKESVSIEAQIADCRSICKEGTRVLEYSDKGYSGKNTERPGLQKMMHDIESGVIGKVIVYKLDRISRNVTDFNNLYTKMKKKNCLWLSVYRKF